MTTILKALQQLEGEAAPCERAVTSRVGRPARLVLPVSLLFALAGGIGAVVWFTQGGKVKSPTPVVSSSVEIHHPAQAPVEVHRLAPVPVEVHHPAPAPIPLNPKTPEEPPWGRAEQGRDAPVPSAASRVGAADAPQHGERIPARELATATRAYVPGERPIQVRSIAYSRNSAARTVTLLFDEEHAVTLHEGESADGVEVQLILRDTVYLRQGSTVFAVSHGR